MSQLLWMAVQATAVLAMTYGMFEHNDRQGPIIVAFIGSVIVVALLTGVITVFWDWFQRRVVHGIKEKPKPAPDEGRGLLGIGKRPDWTR